MHANARESGLEADGNRGFASNSLYCGIQRKAVREWADR